ncbi:hypothetical protein [Paraburkholderia sp. RL17-337-BIB-A]
MALLKQAFFARQAKTSSFQKFVCDNRTFRTDITLSLDWRHLPN